MSKLKFSFLVLMLMVSVSASADWAPADVQAALKKMYPTADDVAVCMMNLIMWQIS